MKRAFGLCILLSQFHFAVIAEATSTAECALKVRAVSMGVSRVKSDSTGILAYAPIAGAAAGASVGAGAAAANALNTAGRVSAKQTLVIGQLAEIERAKRLNASAELFMSKEPRADEFPKSFKGRLETIGREFHNQVWNDPEVDRQIKALVSEVRSGQVDPYKVSSRIVEIADTTERSLKVNPFQGQVGLSDGEAKSHMRSMALAQVGTRMWHESSRIDSNTSYNTMGGRERGEWLAEKGRQLEEDRAKNAAKARAGVGKGALVGGLAGAGAVGIVASAAPAAIIKSKCNIDLNPAGMLKNVLSVSLNQKDCQLEPDGAAALNAMSTEDVEKLCREVPGFENKVETWAQNYTRKIESLPTAEITNSQCSGSKAGSMIVKADGALYEMNREAGDRLKIRVVEESAKNKKGEAFEFFADISKENHHYELPAGLNSNPALTGIKGSSASDYRNYQLARLDHKASSDPFVRKSQRLGYYASVPAALFENLNSLCESQIKNSNSSSSPSGRD